MICLAARVLKRVPQVLQTAEIVVVTWSCTAALTPRMRLLSLQVLPTSMRLEN